jgi:hypothetical protein
MELTFPWDGESGEWLVFFVQLHFQNPEVEKMLELALPMSLMHSVISFMEYLSMCEFWLRNFGREVEIDWKRNELVEGKKIFGFNIQHKKNEDYRAVNQRSF